MRPGCQRGLQQMLRERQLLGKAALALTEICVQICRKQDCRISASA